MRETLQGSLVCDDGVICATPPTHVAQVLILQSLEFSLPHCSLKI